MGKLFRGAEEVRRPGLYSKAQAHSTLAIAVLDEQDINGINSSMTDRKLQHGKDNPIKVVTHKLDLGPPRNAPPYRRGINMQAMIQA